MLSIATGSDTRYLTRQVGQGAEHYYLRAIEVAGEPPGVWLGRGAAELGLSGEVDADVMHDLYHAFLDPRDRERVAAAVAAIQHPPESPEYEAAVEEIHADVRLGSKPRNYDAGTKQRIAEALAREPEASEERRREIEIGVRRTARTAVHYFDLTWSAPKSWSVLHASLQVAGRHEEAQQVWDAWMDGVEAGLEYMQDAAGFSRAGHHGSVPKDARGRELPNTHTTGRYVDAHEWTVAAFRQHTSRDDDPQLHVHTAVLNRVKTTDIDPVTGEKRTVWRTIDSKGVFRHKQSAGHLAERVAEESLRRRLGAEVAMRPDGKAREIVGVPPELCDAFSSRRRAISSAVAEYVAAYEEAYGHAPTAYELHRISEFATLDERKYKKHDPPSRAELLARWERQATDDLRTSLRDVPVQVLGRASTDPRTAQAEAAFQPHEVVRQAVDAVQLGKATWTRSDLIVEINRALPDCLGGLNRRQIRTLVDELADHALAPGGRVLRLTAPDVVDLPRELRRDDGTSIYRPKDAERYATEEHLQAEEYVEAAASTYGAPRIPEAILAGAVGKLSGTQAAAVRDIAGSGRAVDVLVGPAGTGKSYTMGALTAAWESAGFEVFGLAVSERAAQVLHEEGVDHVANVAKVLFAHEFPDMVDDPDAYAFRPGQLVIVDEAGTASTEQLRDLRRLAAEAGAKLLLTGDHGQTASVDAGGMFGYLAEKLPHVHVLDEVRRFRDAEGNTRAWEADASLRLRAGDADVLEVYDRHGRIHAGSEREMVEQAYRAWLAGHLEGRDALLIAATNEQASELSSRARADLVRYGRVEEDGVLLRDRNRAGVGDVVQLRKNQRRLTSDQGSHWATNREVVTVTTRYRDGSLEVAYEDGEKTWLPKDYVAEHVELAYAGTVHAVQGRTVEAAYALVGRGMSREAFYVAMSRATATNTAFVMTHAEVVPPTNAVVHDERMEPTERMDRFALLAGVLARTEYEQTATGLLRQELETADHLGRVAPMWTDIVDQDAAARYGQVLADALGVEEYQRIADSEAYGQLLQLARYTAEQGRNAEGLLRVVAENRELDTALDPAKVLYWRLDTLNAKIDKREADFFQGQIDDAERRQERDLAAAILAGNLRPSDGSQTAPADGVADLAAYDFGTPPHAPVALPARSAVLAERALSVAARTPDTPTVGPAADLSGYDFGALPTTVDTTPVGPAVASADVTAAVAQSLLVADWSSPADHADRARREQLDKRHALFEARASYRARTPEIGGGLGLAARDAAEVLDARVDKLGDQLADAPPAWAVDRLGPVPEDRSRREQWARQAGIVAAYREAHGYTHESDAIGAAPPRGAVDARHAWERAAAALGVDPAQRDLAGATDAALREVVDRYAREEEWAPPHVAEELRDAHLSAQRWRVRRIETLTEAEVADPDRREELLVAAEGFGELYAAAARRVDVLETVDRAREAWHEHTEEARNAASAARTELRRREGLQEAADGPQEAVQAFEGEAGESGPSWVRSELQLDDALDRAHRALDTLVERAADRAVEEAERLARAEHQRQSEQAAEREAEQHTAEWE